MNNPEKAKAHEHWCSLNNSGHFWTCIEEGCSSRVKDLPCDFHLEEIMDDE